MINKRCSVTQRFNGLQRFNASTDFVPSSAIKSVCFRKGGLKNVLLSCREGEEIVWLFLQLPPAVQKPLGPVKYKIVKNSMNITLK
jgi:hypothetical protein